VDHTSQTTIRLHHKDQLVNAVSGNIRHLFWGSRVYYKHTTLVNEVLL